MFYGSGAGKYPTASAVVADIVEEAKNLNNNLLLNWSDEKLHLESVKENRCKFFVRVAGTEEEKLAKVEECFGKVAVVKLDDVNDEFAFVTEVMSEAEFEDAASKMDIKQRIRVEA